MARRLARKRQQIINAAAMRLIDATDSKAFDMIRLYCKRNAIPATDRDIADMASEAIRRRLIAKIKQLQGQLIQLNNKVNGFHP